MNEASVSILPIVSFARCTNVATGANAGISISVSVSAGMVEPPLDSEVTHGRRSRRGKCVQTAHADSSSKACRHRRISHKAMVAADATLSESTS